LKSSQLQHLVSSETVTFQIFNSTHKQRFTAGRKQSKNLNDREEFVPKNKTKPHKSANTFQQKCIKQIHGFESCLSVWISKSFPRFLDEKPVNTDKLFKFFNQFDLVDMVKVFKYILCYNFSIHQEQEIPDGKEEWKIDITYFLSKRATSYVNTMERSGKKNRKVRFRDVFWWNLLQCKVLSSTVPKDFIQKAYEKHHTAMSTPPSITISDELLDDIREFVKPWIQSVVSSYRGITKLPTTHASFENKRDEGGIKKSLDSQIKVRAFQSDFPQVHIEPVVIHLEGPPGSGKSRSIEKIARALCSKFGYDPDHFRDQCYYRSAATKHWDGYRGQLISVLDDFGYATPDSGDHRQELLQLVSDCDYVLPMANLKDKGKLFRSKFLIITSNLGTHSMQVKGFSCPSAYYRRLTPTYKLGKSRCFRYIYRYATEIYDPTKAVYSRSGYEFVDEWQQTDEYKTLPVERIINESMDTFLFRVGSNNKSVWNQVIQEPTNTFAGLSIDYPSKVSEFNSVKVHAIPEPLKCRIITKPMAQTYALKPLQLSMFDSLKRWKCFEPCWNPNYGLDQLGKFKPNNLFLSGDYTAATDELDIRVSTCVIKSLSEAFRASGQDILADYIDWEGGRHVIEYPNHTGLTSVIQQNGQLMGSLLSFPVLCVLNAFTICKATNHTLETVPALIHGDDLAAYVSPEEISSWKAIAKSIGLNLSVGKNYESKRFLSIDSQLFVLNGVYSNTISHSTEAVTQKEKISTIHNSVSQTSRQGSCRFDAKRWATLSNLNSSTVYPVPYWYTNTDKPISDKTEPLGLRAPSVSTAGDTMSLTKTITGKFRLVQRDENSNLTCKDALLNGFSKKHILKYSCDALKISPRSLNVSYRFGGLGLTTDPEYKVLLRDKLIYLYLLSNKWKIKRISLNTYIVPEIIREILDADKCNQITEIDPNADPSELTLTKWVSKQLFKLTKEKWGYKRFKVLDNLTFQHPLDTFKSVIIHYEDNRVQCLQKLLETLKPKDLQKWESLNYQTKPKSCVPGESDVYLRRRPIQRSIFKPQTSNRLITISEE